MSTPNTAQGTQPKPNSIGALILIILTAIAIVVSLILGGIRLFGGNAENPTEEPTGTPFVDPFDPDFKLEAWPSDQPLSGFTKLEAGTLFIATEGYTPDEDSLQTIVRKYKDGVNQFAVSDSSLQINKETNDALLRMLTAMNQEIKFDENISVHSAYSTLRTYQRTGMTVRFQLIPVGSGSPELLENATGDNPAAWLAANAWKYGFVLRYPKGNAVTDMENGAPDYYRYVGVPHAYYITKVLELEDKNVVPTLEDYVALAKNATAKNPIAFEVKGSGADNGVYNVYYVKASDVDKAQIREGFEIYGVSGVGDGYLVTSVIRTGAEDDDGEASSEDKTEDKTEEATEAST